MDGEERQNGEAEPESNISDVKGLSEVDLSSSEQAQRMNEREQQLGSADDQLEFFGGRGEGGGESGGESGGGGDSPGLAKEGRDSDSAHGAFVTISPPVSPDMHTALPTADDVDPSLLESLEDSTSSSDIPRSKLDKKSRKLLDFEVPIAGPGKKRNLGLSEEGGRSVEVEGQSIDLKVSITEREKQGVKSDLYFSYKICTDTSRPAHLFEKSHYEVWRRYRDFEWLREMMEKHHPTLITPPLPGKQVTRYFDQHSEEFLDERQRALNIFLKRLTAHPYFSFDENLKVFLTAETMAFANHVVKTSGSSRMLSSVTSSMKQVANSFRLKVPDPYFAKEGKYFSGVGDKLGVVERIVTRLHQEREELVKTMEDFSLATQSWSDLEQQQLSHSVKKLGSCMENCATAVTDLNTANAYSLLMASREYQLFTASGVSAIRRRDGLQLEMERTGDDRERKKKLHDDAATAGKLQRLPKLADDLQKTSVMADKALDDLSRANEELRVDIDKWKEAKDREVNRLMRKVSDDHINFHQKCFDEWEVVLKLLKKTDETESLGSADTPEHRRRGVAQSGSIEPSTSLISNDMLLARDTEGEGEEGEEDDEQTNQDERAVREEGSALMADNKAEETDNTEGAGDGTPSAIRRQNVTQLPGLFDEDDPESNELFGSTS